jgi:hypothetical protein
MGKTFDLHIAANAISADLLQVLLDSGYREQRVIGGDERVRMQFLLSINVPDRRSADELFERSVRLISGDTSFKGYIEEEAVVFDTEITPGQMGESNSDNVLEKVVTSRCPPDMFKRCDIHLSISKQDHETLQALHALGFYHLELDKRGVGPCNIITLQFEDIAEGRKCCRRLRQHINQRRMIGWLKFEVTINIKNFGFEMPPIVIRDSSRETRRHISFSATSS